ncbi:MAG: hypothetical protein H7A24_12560 [Leptospiraceae bacterium]|nr:hypothetical protein [Leptospiraceae bacterium]
MKELMTALIEAKVDPEKAEKALTSIENAISSRIEVAKMESYTEKIVPIEMETSGIRSEIRLLAEQMKLGFEKMHEEMNLRFEKMDQKMDFIRESLEKRIDATEKLILTTKDNLEKQIISTRENLELQIRANQETNQQKFLALENHLRFHEKLLYTIIGLMVTLSIAVVVKILLV